MVPITTTDIIRDVRSVLDEVNRSRVDDDTDIIPAINRAQAHAASIMARHYEQPLLAHKDIAIVQGQRDYPIPRDALEDRLEKVEVNNNGLFYPVDAISFRDSTWLETKASTNLPTNYAIIGKDFRLYPNASAAYPLRVWYLKSPLTIAKRFGKVTKVNSTFIVTDDVGDVEVGQYVNVIDHRNGQLIGQLQVKRINGTRLEFRDTPDRSEVNQEPVVTLSDIQTASNSTVELIKEDDFICPSGTTCIPFMKAPMTNYYTSYAEGELRRKLGEETQVQSIALKELEKDVERSWAGRESFIRVTQKSPHWLMPRRRSWNSGPQS